MAQGSPAANTQPQAQPGPAAQPTPNDERYFQQTGYRIGDDAFWSFFRGRGGVRSFGYPVSNVFMLLGMKVQIFQRQIMQLQPDGGVQLMNLLDEGLLPVLPQLTARHQVIVAAVADPRVDDLAAGRSDPAAVYDAAAAERSRNERSTIASRLRHSGVEVIDAAPSELAPALADRYLAMKAAGRL